MKTNFFIFVFCLVVIYTASAKDPKKDFLKEQYRNEFNIIPKQSNLLSLKSYCFNGGIFTPVSYERLISKSANSSSGLAIGIGALNIYGANLSGNLEPFSSPGISVNYAYSSGFLIHRMIIDIGVIASTGKEFKKFILDAGYRYQPDNEGLSFELTCGLFLDNFKAGLGYIF